MDMDPKLFPKDFLWGASTASHQVEGGTVNQWSVWELEHASELARSAAKRLSWLPSWKDIRSAAQDPNNYVSGNGVDHYNRYEEDFDLLRAMHFNSFRFGVEWSRIEPEEGTWNLEATRHYHAYIKALNKRNIEPILNIWHWTMPTWFTDKGGFEKKANVIYFEQFVQKIVEEYGDEIRYVIILNEPNVYTGLSYATGEWPPQQKKPLLALRVYRNLVRAHRRSYTILKTAQPSLQIGIAQNVSESRAFRTTNIIAGLGAISRNYLWNWWFLDRIKKQLDFVGLNFYHTNYQRGLFGELNNPTYLANDVGWYMEPEAIYPLLIRASQRYKLPIIITENGVADAKDTYRQWWIEQTLIAMQRALSNGVNLKGYLHWSLLDNFEWSYGWWPKFGLIAVDREDGMKRKPRASAKWFTMQLIKLQRAHAARAKAHGSYEDHSN